jgi:PPOX class probable F420-dependent enzyme
MGRLDISMSTTEVTSFLAAAHTGVLSTLGRGGFPHCAGMWFVRDGDELRMWTYGKSQKAQNVRRDPRCAFLVERGEGYTELRGVMVRTKAVIITDYETVVEIGMSLLARYMLPAAGERARTASPEAEIRRQAEKRVGLALPMERLVSWDHSKLR